MSLTLVFPPRASGTYIPLGMATLAAWVRDAVGPLAVRCHDFNIAYRTLESTAGAAEIRRLCASQPTFFSEPNQAEFCSRLIDQERALDTLEADARAYLQGEAPSRNLDDMLRMQLEKIAEGSPHTFGISLLYPSQIPFGLALAKAVKRSKDFGGPARLAELRVILGGAAVTAVEPEDILASCGFVDGVVLAEGERAAEALARGAGLADIPGLLRRCGGGIVRNPSPGPIDVSRAPLPDFSDLHLDAYHLPEPVLPVLFSRDCRWRRCRFCAHNFSHSGYRKKTPEAFAEELSHDTKRYGARHFYLADQYVGPRDLASIASQLEERRLDVHWHAMARPTAGYTATRLEAMKRGGLVWLSWGVESGSQRLLDLCGKGTRVESITKILENAHHAGISNLAMMIFGLPTSTDKDLERTLDLLTDTFDWWDAATASSFVLFAGTPFAEQAQHFGLIVTEPEVAVWVDSRPIRSKRLKFRELSAEGAPIPPRGAEEVAAWKRRKPWLGPETAYERLSAEHYLLYASQQQVKLNNRPWDPVPPRPAPMRKTG